MKLTETRLSGAFLIEIEPKADDRGFFARTFCRRELEEHGLDAAIAQCNVSYNRIRGTLRGLHYQAPPHAEAKIVRCFSGAIYDVIVDLRPQSRTYLQWAAVELAASKRNALYVPPLFAHGFYTLTDEAEVFYEMMAFYSPESARGIRWDDPALAITWPAAPQVISARDLQFPALESQSNS